jgi:uncharacterized protein involved in exopolysaccharide biosynthesis
MNRMEQETNSGETVKAEKHNNRDYLKYVLDGLVVLYKQKLPITLFSIFFTLLAALYIFHLPAEYKATTVILPPKDSASLTPLAAMTGLGLSNKNQNDTQLSMLRSRTLEESVILRFGLMQRYHAKKLSHAHDVLESHVTLSSGAKDGLITLSVQDSDAQMAADIANGYVEEYRKFSANVAATEAGQRRLFFEQQLLEARQKLAVAEDEMKKSQQDTGQSQSSNQVHAVLDEAAMLRNQLIQKELQIRSLSAFASEDNPDLLLARQQLAALQAQLSRFGSVDPGSAMFIPKSKVSDVELENIRKVRNVAYYSTLSDLYSRQYETARMDEERQGGLIQVIDKAIPPDTPSGPKHKGPVILAFFLSLLLSSGFFLAWDALKRLKTNPSHMQQLGTWMAHFR